MKTPEQWTENKPLQVIVRAIQIESLEHAAEIVEQSKIIQFLETDALFNRGIEKCKKAILSEANKLK